MTVDTFYLTSLLRSPSQVSSDINLNSSTSIVESTLRPLYLDTSTMRLSSDDICASHYARFEIEKCHSQP